MCNGRPVHTDVVIIAKLQEFSTGKLGAILSVMMEFGTPNRWMMSVKKGHDPLCSEIRDWVCLDPFGEFVQGNQQVGVAPERFSQGPDDVQPPHGERPCDGYGLQGVSWEVGFACIKLAPLAGAHDLIGISNRGGPIESLAERVAHEGARHRVVATHTHVDVSNEFPTVGNGDAPLQDPGRGALV
jgi:hypothetical protein